MTSTDEHDIARLQAMDQDAWTRLQDEFFRRIHFFVRRYVENHQTAEDITQDVFLGAVRGIARFDRAYTLEQYLFGIAKNRIVDHFRKHRMPLIAPKGSDDADRSGIWLENMQGDGPPPAATVVDQEDATRRRRVLGEILKRYVGELWHAGEFQKLQVLEYLFVLGGRNKDAAARFGIADEKSVAGIKFRAIEKLRGMARQSDPNHSLFGGLWTPGSR